MPIILCTGFSELVNREKAAALGIRCFPMKPIRPDRLTTAMRTALSPRQDDRSCCLVAWQLHFSLIQKTGICRFLHCRQHPVALITTLSVRDSPGHSLLGCLVKEHHSGGAANRFPAMATIGRSRSQARSVVEEQEGGE